MNIVVKHRWSGAEYLQRSRVLWRYANGEWCGDETLMIVKPNSRETKTVKEWLLLWFPDIMKMLLSEA